jgi:radical SAM superfamily enzyme YgiQ (UPF0313 family)
MDGIDVLFIKPSASKALYGDLGAYDLPAIEPPLWSALLAAYLRERGYSVAILDPEAEGWDLQETGRRVRDMAPHLIAVVVSGANPSASTMNMTGTRLLLTHLKSHAPETPVVLCGLHPSALPRRTLLEEAADFVCQGEGFHTLPALIEGLKAGADDFRIKGLWYRREGRILDNPQAPLHGSLEDLPMPAWDLLPMTRYRAHNWHCFGDINNRQPYGVIYTSLGCPYRCSFCCTNALFGKAGIRYRSPARVIEEIDLLVERFGIRNIKILDEMFVLDKAHVHCLCDLIIERGYDLNMWAYARVNTVDAGILDKMKRAGIHWVAYGFESGNAEVLEGVAKGYDMDSLDSVVKMTYDAGLHIAGNYMFGLPGDDRGSMQATLDMALRINAEWANMYTVMAHPGSRLYDEALERGWPLPDSWEGYSQYGYASLPLPTKHLAAAEVLEFRDRAFHLYHSHPAYLEKIERCFGLATVDHIRKMTRHRLPRKHVPGDEEARTNGDSEENNSA